MESRRTLRKDKEGSIREVAGVAWPIVISMLSYTAMGVADTIVVGWIGVTELAAVGLATTAVFLINSLFMGTLHGVKVLSSQATGAGEHDRAGRAGWQGVFVAVPFGLMVIVIGLFDAYVFELMGGPPEVQAAAREYFAVRVLGAPVWYIAIALSDYFQGTGDTKTPMKMNLVVNGLNIGLNFLLVFGWGPIEGMGVVGAAWATVLASGVGMLIITTIFVRRVGVRPELDLELVKDLVRVGLPIGVKYTLHIAGFTVFTAVVARMGEVQLAANQIAFKVISISFLPGHGIGEAATVLTGQYLGARKFDGLKRSFYSSLWLSVSVMSVFGVVFWLVPEWFVRIFSDDAEVIALTSELLILAAWFQVFDAVEMTAAGALNGVGDTRFTMWVSIAGAWLVLVPLSILLGLVLELGVWGAWMALTVQIAAMSVAVLWRFWQEPWR